MRYEAIGGFRMKILNVVITLALSIILLGALLVPVISDAQTGLKTEHTYTSEGAAAHMDKLEVSDSHTLTWQGGILTVDGVEYPLWTSPVGVAFLTESLGLYVSKGNLYIGQSGQAQAALYSASTLSLIASAGQITYSINDADAIQTTYTSGYILSNDGKYITGESTTNKYYTDSMQVSGYRSDSGVLYIMIDGKSYTDGTNQTNFRVDGTDVEGTDGNVKTLDGVFYSGRGLSAYVIPETVSYWTEDNPAAIALLGALPVLIIAALIVAAVGVIYIRRTD